MQSDPIANFVKGAFAGVPETTEVLEQQAELIASLRERVSDLVAEGYAHEEATGIAVASLGDLTGLVGELDEAAAAKRAMVAVKSRPLNFHAALLSILGIGVAYGLLVFVLAFSRTPWVEAGLIAVAAAAACVLWLLVSVIALHIPQRRPRTVDLGDTGWVKRGLILWALAAVGMVVVMALTWSNTRFLAWGYLGIGLLGAVFLLRAAIIQLLVRGGRFVDETAPSSASEQR